jgi:hypothetical protein
MKKFNVILILILGWTISNGQTTPAHEIAFAEHDDIFGGGAFVRVRPPDQVAGFRRVKCDRYQGSTAILRGWIKLSGGSPKEHEVHYDFEPDIQWLKDNGVDLKFLLHAGNVYLAGENNTSLDGMLFSNGWYAVAHKPKLKIELVGWNVTEGKGHPSMKVCNPPVGWTRSLEASQQFFKPNDIIVFPYNPFQFLETTYVEIEGSIVADNCHCLDNVLQQQRAKGAWGKTACCTCLTVADYNDQSRWIEVHPPDRITPILPEPVHKEQVLIAIISPYANQSLGFDLKNPVARPVTSAGANMVWKNDYELMTLHVEGSPVINLHEIGTNAIRIQVDLEKGGGPPGFEWSNSPRYLGLLTIGGWKSVQREVVIDDQEQSCKPPLMWCDCLGECKRKKICDEACKGKKAKGETVLKQL